MVDTLRLAQIATALEVLSAAPVVANPDEAGYWKRIASALETEIGTSSSANATYAGYLKRSAVALEGYAGTSGAEENATEPGYLKRIVDALETSTGVTVGSWIKRFHAAALAWSGAATALYIYDTPTELSTAPWVPVNQTFSLAGENGPEGIPATSILAGAVGVNYNALTLPSGN